MNNDMQLLDIAIAHEGGVSRLAESLGLKPNIVGMWRNRQRLNTPWRKYLAKAYGEQILNASEASRAAVVIDRV